MANAKELTAEQYKIVDEHTGQMLAQLIGDKRLPDKVEAGETFRYYMLGHDDIRAKKPINEAAKDIGHYIHMLYADGRPNFHAVSGPGEEQEWEVHAVVNSALSVRLDEAIEWADKNHHGDCEAVVLNVPALYLQFLWIQDPAGDIFYALTWQNEDKIFTEQRKFSESELRNVLFSIGGPRGVVFTEK